MGLFGRHSRQSPSPAAPPGRAGQPGSRLGVAGLAGYAAARGWRAAGDCPLDSSAQDFVHDAARTMYGAPRSMTYRGIRVTPTSYQDCFYGTVAGHEFMVANGWTSIVELCAVSVCQVRLDWFLGEPVWIEPARFVSAVPARLLATGDPAFDRQFRVHGANAQTVAELLRENVRALIAARIDWFFTFGGASLLCVCREGYRAPQDVARRLTEVTGIAAALPSPSAQRAAARPVALSGGVVYDPAHIEDWKAALAAMPPDRQRQLLDELRARLAGRRAQRPAR
jgi:hypothetical protein